MSGEVPRNDQMHGFRGKAGRAPGEGWWEKRIWTGRMKAE